MLMAAGGAYAQEVEQKVRQRVKSVTQNPNKKDSFEQVLNDADALIRSGKPVAAYALLEPFEFEHAGEVRFDYLIGTAALDSGKPDKATLAFERVLAVNPDFPAARLDMARAYYQLGDLPRAKTEFTMALKQNPSEKTQASIEKYLNEITTREAGKQTHISGYVEGAIGHDSNVNNSTSQSQIFVDAFPATIITLDPSNVKTSDHYYGVAAGGEITHTQNANIGLYAGADLKQRGNSTQKSFDSRGLNARAGLMLSAKADQLRIEVLGGRYNLGRSHNYDSTGLKGDWRHVFSPSNQLNVFAQSVQYRFVDPLMQPNDIDQQAMGLGLLHVLPDGKSTLSGSVHFGTEKDVAPIITLTAIGIINPSGGRNDGAKRFRGLRVGGQTVIYEKAMLYASAGIQVGDYNKVNYLFLRQRHDRLYDLKFGADWHWNRLWTLRPQLNYSRNDSNIVIYGYDRMDVSLTVRRDFR